MGKIFGTDGIRCLVNEEPLTPETTLKISKAAGYLLKSRKKKNSRVIICKDTRLSGYLYEPLITAGFISMGMEVVLVGPLPTPAVPHLMRSLRADIGVMITASHNTYEYNGLKFFNSDGYKISTKLENKIEDAFSLSNYDDIYSYLTASGRNGPELLDITTDNTQKQFVRLYSAIASSPILSNTFTEGRDLLVQSVLDLINPPSPLPNRLVDYLNVLFTEKTSSLASSFVLPSGTALSPEGLDRLNRVTNLVGTGGSSDLLAASEFSTNTSQLLNTLSDQNIISDTGSLLNNFGQPVLSDGEPLIISDYQSLVSSFVDTTLFTLPNRPSNTNLCVLVPSKVPVIPIRYSQLVSLVIILVNETALNK